MDSDLNLDEVAEELNLKVEEVRRLSPLLEALERIGVEMERLEATDRLLASCVLLEKGEDFVFAAILANGHSSEVDTALDEYGEHTAHLVTELEAWHDELSEE